MELIKIKCSIKKLFLSIEKTNTKKLQKNHKNFKKELTNLKMCSNI